jgi:hypothetical protein
MKTFRSALIAALLCCAGFASASAATITFDGLPGANNDLFTSFSEAGFNVASSDGQVFVGQNFGNPVPSLFGGPLFGADTFAVTLTRLGGGAFTFQGFDLASNGGTTTFAVLGRLAGSTLLSTTGQQSATSGFVTLTNGSTSTIDTLVLSFTAGGTSANIDNIRVTATAVSVPEPASVALLFVGLAGLGVAKRARWQC